MKISKKLIALFMTAMLAAGVAGCGNETTAESVALSTENKTEVTKEKTEKTVQTEEIDLSYPIKDAQGLSVYNVNMVIPSNCASYEEVPFWQGLEKNTGVNIDMEFPVAGADLEQSFNLLLTDEELPDIIMKMMDASDGEILLNDGIIYDLTEYLPIYAPDYWEVMNRPEYQSALRAVTTSSGKQFCVAGLRESLYNICYGGPVVRKDWLEECGLEEPVTVEDWENMLVTFKEKYNARMGFTMGYFSWLGGGIGSGVGAYGAFDAKYYVDDNGKVQCGQVQPEWQESMEILHRWYEMGLIDPDVLTMNNDVMRSKVLNNEIGASFTAMSQITNWMADAEAENTGAEWMGVSYLRTAPGEPTNMIPAAENFHNGYCAVITTSCPEEKLIEALRWLNYGFTEEGHMYWNFGTEGETYTIDADGNVAFTELITESDLGIDLAINNYCGMAGTGIAIQAEDMVKAKNNKIAGEAVDKWIENTDAIKYSLPSLPLDSETATELNDLSTVVYTRIQEIGYKYLTGEESLDNFDSFVEELNSIGLERILEIYQTAYDDYVG